MENLTDKIIIIANKVYNKLGSGHTESVYHRAMEVELRLNNIMYESEVVTPIYYEDHYVGSGRADIVVNRVGKYSMVLELKSLASLIFKPNDLGRLRTYMKSLNIEQGMMINFCQLNGREKCNFNMITNKVRKNS